MSKVDDEKEREAANNPEPLIDLAVVYPYWDGLLHPRWVTKEEMLKLFPRPPQR
jgi:hypothetical protein